MSTDNNEISQEKNDFISNVAQAIKRKLDFEILGYGPRKSQNVFFHLAEFMESEGCASNTYYACIEQLARRMKYEFGGYKITNVSELIKLIQEIGCCNWPGYWEKKTNSEEFLNFDDKVKKIYQNYVETLRNFWEQFLFKTENSPISKQWIESRVGEGIIDKNYPKEDYKFVSNEIIKSVDDLIRVMVLICQNRTYLYFQPIGSIFWTIAHKLTVNEIFGQVTLEQLKKILAVQKEIMRNVSNLRGIFEFDSYWLDRIQSFDVINKILEQSNDTKIVREIIQWLKQFGMELEMENEEFLQTLVLGKTYSWLEHFATDSVQLKLDDVCYFLALYFQEISRDLSKDPLISDGVAKLLDYVLVCCSVDISENNLRLDLDFILNIKEVETLIFAGGRDFSAIFRLLNENRDKISFSDDFIKKVFNSRFKMTHHDYISLEKLIYDEACSLLNSANNEEREKSLTGLKMTIDFMLRNSLTKATKEAGNNFVKSLAQIINDSGNERKRDKLVVDFVFKVLRNNKMVDREKLFINTLVPELRPEITSIDNETEQENSNIDGTKPNLSGDSNIDNANTETNINHDADVDMNSENPHVAANQNEKEDPQKDANKYKIESHNLSGHGVTVEPNQANVPQISMVTDNSLEYKAGNRVQKVVTQLQYGNPNTQASGQPNKGSSEVNQQFSSKQGKVLEESNHEKPNSNLNFSEQLKDIYFERSQNYSILNGTVVEIYDNLKESANFCRNVCMLEAMLEPKKYRVLSKKLTSFQRFRVTIYYYCFFWWYYRRNNKIDFSQPGIGNYCVLKHNLGGKSNNEPEPKTYSFDRVNQK